LRWSWSRCRAKQRKVCRLICDFRFHFLLLFTNVRFLQETNVYDWTILATFSQIFGLYRKPMLRMVWGLKTMSPIGSKHRRIYENILYEAVYCLKIYVYGQKLYILVFSSIRQYTAI
jgi:hypothetical protein